MPRDRMLLGVLVLLVVAGLVSGVVSRRQTRVEVPLAAGLPQPTPASSETRSWRTFPGREMLARPFRSTGPGAASPPESPPEAGSAADRDPAAASELLPIQRPGLLAAGDEAVYLVDFADLLLRELSPSLEVRRVLRPPNATEAPPWETVQPMDVAVVGQHVWVADPPGRQVLAFDSGGALSRHLRLDRDPFRLAVADDGRVTVLVPTGEASVYETYGTDGEGLSQAGPLLDPELQMPFTLDGFLVPDGDGGFVHVLRNRSLLAAWSGDGDLRYLVEPVAPHPPPAMLRSGSGVLRGDPEAPFSALAADAHGGDLFVLTTEDGTLQGAGVIDVYSIVDGRYRYSWRLPERWRGLAVTGERLVALTGDSIRVYRWR